jgi:hypothetical protein
MVAREWHMAVLAARTPREDGSGLALGWHTAASAAAGTLEADMVATGAAKLSDRIPQDQAARAHHAREQLAGID